MKFLILTLLTSTIVYAQTFYSQYGQDQYLHDKYFKNKKNGFFVELGAYDGIEISNSYFFEKHMNWNGICIEAMPDEFQKLKKNRNCICINECISSDHKPKTFYRIRIPENERKKGRGGKWIEMLSGIKENYDPQQIRRILRTLKNIESEVETFTVKPKTLQEVFNTHNTSYVDFLSLDIEGGELGVLKTINYDKVRIKVIMVENNYNDPEIREFLLSKGYKFDKKYHNDEVFFWPED